MNQEHTRVDKGDVETAGCCGAEAGQATEGCPCGSMLKGHRVAVVAVLAVMGLALLISQAGGVLGIIAFFRTF